jgi:hypothetical protein
MPKTIDTINLQNFENALMITLPNKKIFLEKFLQKTPPTQTTLREQVGYIWITSKELARILWSAVSRRAPHRE